MAEVSTGVATLVVNGQEYGKIKDISVASDDNGVLARYEVTVEPALV